MNGTFPVDDLAPRLIAALSAEGAAVVIAPPGSGKTTRVPLHLLDAFSGRIVLTEPRRVAARNAARRMAASFGEPVGQTVGYRMRNETRVSSSTRIEVVTEGVFLRMLHDDPSLDGVSVVLFDEVHERSLDIDVSLALTLDARAALRPDLCLVAMSATLDGSRYAQLIANATSEEAPVLSTTVPTFPVEIRYQPTLMAHLVDGVSTALATTADLPGDVLVFLPGQAEIHRVSRRLAAIEPGVDVFSLTGSSTPEEVERALGPGQFGRRKVILATAVAQTSVTIPGLGVVIDSGLHRRASFDPVTGTSRLVTVRVSKATATQRAGRVGRERQGVAVRLWSDADFARSAEADVAEILDAELTDVVLDLAAWGVTNPDRLRWVDRPEPARWSAGVSALQSLGCLDEEGFPTELGRQATRFPASARMAALLLSARLSGDCGSVERAIGIVAALDGTDATRLRRALGTPYWLGTDSLSAGYLFAKAFPERIASRSSDTDPTRYVLACGIRASLSADDPNVGAALIVAIELDGDRTAGRVFRSEPLTPGDVEALHLRTDSGRVVTVSSSGTISARVVQRFGQAVLATSEVAVTDDDRRLARLRAVDLPALFDEPGPAALLSRLRLVERVTAHGDRAGSLVGGGRRVAVEGVSGGTLAVPDAATGSAWDVTELAADLGWLAAFADKPVTAQTVTAALLSRLSYEQRRELDELAPQLVAIPSGRLVEVDYRNVAGPTIEAKLQEFFGASEGPSICRGSLRLRLELLSPAGRPTAITSDLGRFWTTGYPAVRAELRGRYPKHPWPDDPCIAAPTARTTKRSG